MIYRFTSLTAPAGVVTPGVTATGEAVSGDWAVTLGLGMELDGEIWAVADNALTLNGATLTTDDAGEARFELGTAGSPADLDLSPSLELSDGRYVLTVQLSRDGDAVGRTYAAPLLVGSAAEAAPGDDSTPGDGSAPGDTGPGNDSGDDGSGGSTDPGDDPAGDGGSPDGGPGDNGTDPGDGSDNASDSGSDDSSDHGSDGPGDAGDGLGPRQRAGRSCGRRRPVGRRPG